VIPLASGRTADVFAVDELRVLRRYRGDADVAGEAAVMAHVDAHGFPVPKVYDAGGRDMVLERLSGPTMAEAFVTGALDLDAAARMLAGLHAALHAIPARLSADPADRVLHLDLHPENVLLSPHGPVVIDWCNATDGPPDLDVAQTGLILAEVAVDDGHPLAPVAGPFLPAFLRHARWRPPGMLDRALEYRRRDPILTAAEVDRLPAAAGRVRAAAGPWPA
jgi:Ser/Thr protein kinase RdoA (MazF antagonist)